MDYKEQRHQLCPRRGAVLIQCLVLLTVLVGITSLGADYGRVQLAKLELERCAVAAARAAGAKVLSDQETARDLAVAYGAYNQADGASVVIDRAQDVEFGRWHAGSRTFTPLGGAAAATADAVRVTARRTSARGNAVLLAFGAVIGRASVDVSASSVVSATSSEVSGFVGLDGFYVKNNFWAQSYNSNVGPPGGANIGTSAVLGSNGALSLGNNGDLYGSVITGPDGSLVTGTNLFMTGGQSTRSTPISFPPTEPSPVPSSGAYDGTHLVLSAGTYSYTSMVFGNLGRITTNGPVTIYVSGNFTAGQGMTFEPYQSIPSNLRIRMIGAGTMIVKSNAQGAAEIYAPEATLSFWNNLTLSGSIVGKSLSVFNNATLFHDTASGAGEGSVVMTTVQ